MIVVFLAIWADLVKVVVCAADRQSSRDEREEEARGS
jgi:hypothetical protein